MPETVVVVETSDAAIVALEGPTVLQIAALGPQGAPGPTGPPGPPGADGGGSFAYVHDQAAPLSTWVVTHNLGGFPNVATVDSAGTVVEGEIVYNTVNQITITFSAPFSGKAYLS